MSLFSLPPEIIAKEIATRSSQVLNTLLRTAKALQQILLPNRPHYEKLGLALYWITETIEGCSRLQCIRFRVNSLGQKHGPYREYSRSERLASGDYWFLSRETHYRRDIEHGRRRRWWACSGHPVLLWDTPVVNGHNHGIARTYNKHTGDLYRELTYFRGKPRGGEKIYTGNQTLGFINSRGKRIGFTLIFYEGDTSYARISRWTNYMKRTVLNLSNIEDCHEKIKKLIQSLPPSERRFFEYGAKF